MKVIHHNLGKCQKGSVVEISLAGGSAKVHLLDQANYEYYIKGKNYNYFGGMVTKPPVRLSIPYNNDWHVVIDPFNPENNIKSEVRFVTQ